MADGTQVTVSGTLFGKNQVPQADRGRRLRHRPGPPSGYLLFFVYTDRPGVVGTVGAALGEAGVNIAGAQVSRTTAGGEALMAVTVDSPVGRRAARRHRRPDRRAPRPGPPTSTRADPALPSSASTRPRPVSQVRRGLGGVRPAPPVLEPRRRPWHLLSPTGPVPPRVRRRAPARDQVRHSARHSGGRCAERRTHCSERPMWPSSVTTTRWSRGSTAGYCPGKDGRPAPAAWRAGHALAAGRVLRRNR